MLGIIAATIGPVPHVLLRDTDLGEVPSPLVQPGSDAMPAPADQRVERAQRFGGDVLEDEEARHPRTMPNAAGSAPIANRHAFIAASAA